MREQQWQDRTEDVSCPARGCRSGSGSGYPGGQQPTGSDCDRARRATRVATNSYQAPPKLPPLRPDAGPSGPTCRLVEFVVCLLNLLFPIAAVYTLYAYCVQFMLFMH